MKRIALIYGSTTGATRRVAGQLAEALAELKPEMLDASEATPAELAGYDVWVCGVSTWALGEVQDDWALLAHRLESADCTGKTVAVFGLGDQKSYPDTFCNAMGSIAGLLRERGATLIGQWPTEGYDFSGSTAVEDGQFLGLAIDEDSQPDRTGDRIEQWARQITRELDA